MLQSCIIIFNLIASAQASYAEHQRIQAAFSQASPECPALIQREQKRIQEEQKKKDK